MSGMEHEPATRHAVGTGVDRRDELTVGPAELDGLDFDLVTPFAQCSHPRKR